MARYTKILLHTCIQFSNVKNIINNTNDYMKHMCYSLKMANCTLYSHVSVCVGNFHFIPLQTNVSCLGHQERRGK